MVTIDELSKKVETLENENAALKLSVNALNNAAVSRVATTQVAGTQVSASDTKVLLEKESKILQLQNDLNTVKAKVNNLYSSDDLSEYLTGIIGKFNSQNIEGDAPVAYMVSNVDLELKAQVVKDGNDFKFMSADPETKSADSMSTIKISVKAVPK
jgi:exonuclease VII small subunit